eukprot:SAG11_NODE_2460_length_3337_cov_3.537544_4_plen_318_part_00
MASVPSAEEIAAVRAALAAEAGATLSPSSIVPSTPGLRPSSSDQEASTFNAASSSALVVPPTPAPSPARAAAQAALVPDALGLAPLTIDADGSVVTTECRFHDTFANHMIAMLEQEAEREREAHANDGGGGDDGDLEHDLGSTICDVVFVVGPLDLSVPCARLPAIRAVLACRSKAFRQLLFAGEYQHAIEVPIAHSSAPAFKAMLHYVHAGKLQLDPTFAVELLALATRYALPELQRCAASFIEQNLHHGHAAHMLQQAFAFDAELFDRCLEFVAWSATDVIETEGFFCLSEEVLIKVSPSPYRGILPRRPAPSCG